MLIGDKTNNVVRLEPALGRDFMRAHSLRAAVASVAMLVTAGCIHLVKFSGEATEFNIQVADAQNKTLLLNVVRAAHRFPMHFTELSTLSGTGTLTVGGTLTVPAGILNGGMSTGAIAPTGSITETPTFNVAVLETQEFYQGMLKSISVDQISNYINEGLQPELVYSLAFGEILYQDPPDAQAIKFENNFHAMPPPDVADHPAPDVPACFGPIVPPQTQDGKVSEYSCFKRILQALIMRRLTTEPVKSVSNLGPLLSQEPFNDLKWLSGFDPKVIKITAVEADDCKETVDRGLADSCPEGMKGLPRDQRDALEKGLRLYRLQKETSESRFCFDQPLEKRTDQPKYVDLPSKIEHANIPPNLLCHNRLPKDYRPPKGEKAGGDKKIDRPFALALSDGSQSDDPFTVQVEPRSTEGIIYYLGEIGRCEMKLDDTTACVTPKIAASSRLRDSPEDVLFTVQRGDPSRPSLNESDATSVAVNWAGYRYSVPVDPTARDRSGQVLRILTQLVALNRSAKDFPTPAVVPILTH